MKVTFNFLSLTNEEKDNLHKIDLKRLTEVVDQGYEDTQQRVNNTTEDHRYYQGALKVLCEISNILSKTPRK